MGVAPRANLVSVKVSDDDGNTTVLDVIDGIQFAVDNKAQYGIRVINLSLSSTRPSPTGPTRWTRPSSRRGTPASWWSPPPATRRSPATA